MGVSGPVFVDADGSRTFESALEYARREVSATDGKRPLETRLGSYDSAVSTQAASLLRAQDPSGFEQRIRSMIKVAPAQVANGLTAYLTRMEGEPSASARGEFRRVRLRPYGAFGETGRVDVCDTACAIPGH